MKVAPQNFSQLNAYLEKIEKNLHNTKNKELNVMRKVDQVVSEHFDLVNASDLKEVTRFLNSIKRIEELGEKQFMERGVVRGIIGLASSWLFDKSYESRMKERGLVGLAIDAIAASSGSLSLEEIQEFKAIDEFLYYESLAKYISDKKLPIASLELSKEEMLKTAHWLTHLDLTGAQFSTSFCTDLLRSTPNLSALIIKDDWFNPRHDLGLNKKNLKVLEIANCPYIFLHLNEYQNLESLAISGSTEFDQSVNELRNLKHLKIENCRAFNQEISLEHLESLEIRNYNRFNKLGELPNLKRLVLDGMINFNQSVSALTNLESLEVSQCIRFNQSLDRLVNLRHLKVEGSIDFNQSVSTLKNLESLEVNKCINFNSNLDGLFNLIHLKVEGSNYFNPSLSGLISLESLEISNCNHFNQSLEDLFNLRRLKISDCPALEINDLQTARVLKKFNPGYLLDPKANISYELQLLLVEDTLTNIEEQMKAIAHTTPNIRDDLSYLFQLHIPPVYLPGYYARFPLCAELLTIYEYSGNYREGSSGFNLVNATDILLMREVIIYNLEKLNGLHVLDQLPLDSKIALLPLFTPDQIAGAIAVVPEETKTKWQHAPVSSQYFQGETLALFAEIESENIQGTNQETRNNLVAPLTELVTTTPFYTLAALAFDYPKGMLNYTFVMDEPQMACVIPAISVDALVEHLKAQPIQTHREYLMHASTRQKAAYIDQDLLKEPEPLAEWDQAMAHIEELMSSFEQSKTKEDYQQLEKSWRETVQQTKIAAQIYQQTNQALKGILLKFSPNQAFEEKVITYLEPKMQRSVDVLQSLKTIGKQIEALESQVQGLVKIPEEYLDIITGEPMTDPYHHPTTPNNILDNSTWDMLEMHPTTREPINQEELVPDSELKIQIEALREKHPELWDE
jgi:hypothetical protein